MSSGKQACSVSSPEAPGREARAGKAAREARARFHLYIGGFFYAGREKPHVIREYGRHPTEVIFETADSDEYDAAIQRIEDEFVGKAALGAAAKEAI